MAVSVEELFTRAVASFQAGRLEDAERCFTEVLQYDPKHVAALNLLGILLAHLKRHHEAERVLQSALNLNSNSDATFYNYGIVLKALKRPSEALERFSQALAINSAAAETWNNRGTVFSDLKRYVDAISDFNKAVALNPNYPEAFCNKGKSCGALKRYDEASAAYDEALTLKPDLAEAWVGRGDVFFELECHDEAITAYDKALALKPDLAEAWLGRGKVYSVLKRYDEAFAAYDEALTLKPDLAEAWLGRGKVYSVLKRYDEAFAAYDEALTLKPDLAEAWLGRGKVYSVLKRFDEAFAAYDEALTLKPDLAEAWLGRGNVFTQLHRHDEAITAYDKALALKPDLAEAWLGRGNVFTQLHRHDEAFAAYDEALTLKPDLAEAWLGRGNVFTELKRFDEAFAAYDEALTLKPDLAEAWLGRGNVFTQLHRHDEAFAAYDEALTLKPDLAEAWLGRGNVFTELKRYDEAFAAYDEALTLKPDLAEAWLGRGNVFNAIKRHEEAAGAYAQVLKIDPRFPFAKGRLLHQKMLSCDWKDVDDLIAEIERDVVLGNLSAEPFGWQGVAKSPRNLQLCAKLFNKENFPTDIRISARLALSNHGKVRIGYLSGELREQATSHLIVGVLEHHDHSRFEIYGIDNGWDDKSELRRRIDAAVNGIIDIRQLGDELAVAAIQDNQIDILVNLNGYFGEHRMAVFARRCAPIQVNYLGFPGTLGADYIDYIIADQCVIPENHKEFYTEKVVYLPHCYQANDDQKKIGTYNFSRAELGLPEEAFVFCCFNNNYKIIPNVFECWTRILKQIEGSVLWLIEDNAAAASNLRKEATARGISAERLVFAKRMPLPDHLARHRLGGLFLDTLPSNAHTTGSDALWAGLPVLTQIGESFPGRVAASMLQAVGLPELIARTEQDYENIAIDLATHSEKLALIRDKLTRNRLSSALFDTKRYTRHLEAAYRIMHERHQKQLPPDHVYVPA